MGWLSEKHLCKSDLNNLVLENASCSNYSRNRTVKKSGVSITNLFPIIFRFCSNKSYYVNSNLSYCIVAASNPSNILAQWFSSTRFCCYNHNHTCKVYLPSYNKIHTIYDTCLLLCLALHSYVLVNKTEVPFSSSSSSYIGRHIRCRKIKVHVCVRTRACTCTQLLS